ncbi:MAG: Eco57I restriction-modification methylase domain-containing protein [Gemmatimonadales bacterium]
MLIETLRKIRRAADLTELFTLIGYTAYRRPFDDTANVVARWKSFFVIALDVVDLDRDLRHLARRLASSAERALVVAVGPDRVIALTAPRFGQPGITRVLSISLDNPSRFGLQQLERLRPVEPRTSLAHALYVAEVLSSEQVSDRFFTAFRIILERMTTALGNSGSPADRKMVALISLTRILFLYFVQAKGWLDGRPDYLRTLLDDALSRRQDFHRTVLRPLFFGTLNRPYHKRFGSTIPGRVPYLNGGLFEPHPSERRVGQICLPNELWRDAFDGVFEKFRFCVREEVDSDAIAPDMLGRAFERMMDLEERHSTGTFYTPASVVRQIVDSAIRLALENDLSSELVNRLHNAGPVTSGERAEAGRVMRQLRLLDPAVGSGAFLLGALECLVTLNLTIGPSSDRTRSYTLRRTILRENLFGVDINPIAVRLAELRLWLAVIADDPTEAIDEVEPLPNLDAMVRQGDTLLDPLGAARSFDPGCISLARCSMDWDSNRTSVFDARGSDHRRTIRRLRQRETKLAHDLIGAAIRNTERSLADLTAAAHSPDLFGKQSGLTTSQKKRYQRLIQVYSDLQAARLRLADGTIPFFSFEVHSPDVMASGGFNVVVGNPPWVRAERIEPQRRKTLQQRFTWWSGNAGRGFKHLPDLSVAFIERCLELTAPGGSIGLLVPSKVSSAGYGERVRRGLVRETSIAYIHRVDEQTATRFGATTYPLALVLRKKPPSQKHKVRLDFTSGHSVEQQSLDSRGPWILVPDKVRDCIEEFRNSGRRLDHVAPPSLGVKTGADRVLVGTVIELSGRMATVAFGEKHVTLEGALLKSAIRGRDIRAFRPEPKQVVFWGHDAAGVPLTELPPRASDYTNTVAEQLRSRSDYKSGPIWAVFRVRAALRKNRIVWPDIARRPRAVALDETEWADAVPLNTCYVAPAPDRSTALALTAILNSSWSMMLCHAMADEARGGYRRINARVVSEIPVPPAGRRYQDLVHLSRELHQGKHVTHKDLDEAVAEAFSLSARSRRVITSLAENSR